MAEFPRRMDIILVDRYESGRSKFVVLVGEGRCPWCGWGAMRAEAGQRGFCPSCAGPVLAALRVTRG